MKTIKYRSRRIFSAGSFDYERRGGAAHRKMPEEYAA